MIPIYGYIAAAYTTFLSYLFLLFAHMWLVKRIGMQKSFDYRFVFVIVICITIVGILINYSYGNTILRSVFLVFILSGILFISLQNKPAIMKLYKMVRNG